MVRKSVHKWVITSISKAQLHVEEAITILNESGRVHGAAYIYYDRFRKVRRLKGKIFRADGTLVRKIKRTEILDVSLADNATFFSDSRAKIIEFAYGTYPFTIEYSYVLAYKGYLNLDRWQPLKESLAVESASLTVSHPTGLPVRYHLLGGMSEPGASLQNGI
ncbi:MAG: DUF3857 domain-containing protein, partial [Chloroflexi bacterium]|nr:DUF3857 domain-containing protein [Chloroflexota bacterium]